MYQQLKQLNSNNDKKIQLQDGRKGHPQAVLKRVKPNTWNKIYEKLLSITSPSGDGYQTTMRYHLTLISMAVTQNAE